MDIFKQGMKGPIRPAPAAPKFGVNRYSPVTNWNDDPFGTDVFEPLPQQKKKPPPRPPPPKLTLNVQPDIPEKPSHFNRKPTVLSALLSRRNRPNPSERTVPKNPVQPNVFPNVTEVNTNRLFPKCEPKNMQTGALIDLSSPPSSPTFTTRSSSDGLSVDSFGSDVTTSTSNQHHAGNISQTESGFEDDFDLFLNSRNRDELSDDVHALDPFSPAIQKPSISKKPTVNKDYMDLLCNFKTPQTVLPQTAPTIIRAKPARPKPPENFSILKSTFGNSLPVTNMNINTVAPIQKIGSNFGDTFESTELCWDEEDTDVRDSSPPMPTIPPPPPPPEVFAMEENVPVTWEGLNEDEVTSKLGAMELVSCNYNAVNEETPYGIALYDYSTGHLEDLSFTTNTKVYLVRRVNDEWLVGRLVDGSEGLFPSNYVEIKIPLPDDVVPPSPFLGTALVLYNFESNEPGDLALSEGDKVKVLKKINDDWYYGECRGCRGQFPANYVDVNVY